MLHICGKYIPKVLHGVALIKYSERDTIVQRRSFYNMFLEFCIQKSSASTTMEGLPSSFISTICFNSRAFAFFAVV